MPPKPPKRLPRRYREIWLALREADERFASRAELCRHLGVSTHTVQRILVDGEVPDFSKVQSTRLTRSWARTLTRLAGQLGREPRPWIEGVGIRWDEGVRRASEATSREFRRGGGRVGGTPAAFDGLGRIRSEAAKGNPDPVEAGYVDMRPFVDPLPGEDSFFESYASRLVGALDPSWGVRARRGAAGDLVDALTAEEPALSLALGLFETAHLRSRGLEFLPLPGWRLAFSAVWVAPPSRSPPLTWREMASADPGGGLRYLVQDCDPALSLVRSQWARHPERIVVRRRAVPEAIAEDLQRLVQRRPDGAVAFIADEETCRRVLDALEHNDGFGREIDAVRVVPPAEERPRVQLGIAVRADSGRWLELLEHAGREELFGASRAVTARLYADLLTTGWRSLVANATPDDPPTNVRPEHFPEADAEFQRSLARRLVESLLAMPELVVDGDVAADEEWDRVVRVARSLVPVEWRTTVDETAWAAKVEATADSPTEKRPFHTYCRSCSGSLREYPGPSPSYCRYCSDESGNLLPRDEVQRLIAEWMTFWQDGISEAEAVERAARYMSAMPAWAEGDRAI